MLSSQDCGDTKQVEDTLSEQGIGRRLLRELEEGRATRHAGHLVLDQRAVSDAAKLGEPLSQVLHGRAKGQVANEQRRSRLNVGRCTNESCDGGQWRGHTRMGT
jgi:hypothetical protein